MKLAFLAFLDCASYWGLHFLLFYACYCVVGWFSLEEPTEEQKAEINELYWSLYKR